MDGCNPWKAIRQLYDQFKIDSVKVKAIWANCTNSDETYGATILAQMAIDPTKSSDDPKLVYAADMEGFHQQKWNRISPAQNYPVVCYQYPSTLSGKSMYRSTEERGWFAGAYDPVIVFDAWGQGGDGIFFLRPERFQFEVTVSLTVRGLRYKKNVLLLP